MNELDHAYLAAHEQSRRLHAAPPQTPTVADLAHAALTEMLGSAVVRPSLAGIERDRVRTARTGRCVDAAILASHVPTLTAAARDVLALHKPTGIVTCGARTDGAVPHRHSNGHTAERVMTCSNPEGHEGPHKDAVCCWSFHSFSDGVPGVGLDLRSCADCGRTWPCRTYTALAAHLDLTDPEGDPS